MDSDILEVIESILLQLVEQSVQVDENEGDQTINMEIEMDKESSDLKMDSKSSLSLCNTNCGNVNDSQSTNTDTLIKSDLTCCNEVCNESKIEDDINTSDDAMAFAHAIDLNPVTLTKNTKTNVDVKFCSPIAVYYEYETVPEQSDNTESIDSDSDDTTDISESDHSERLEHDLRDTKMSDVEDTCKEDITSTVLEVNLDEESAIKEWEAEMSHGKLDDSKSHYMTPGGDCFNVMLEEQLVLQRTAELDKTLKQSITNRVQEGCPIEGSTYKDTCVLNNDMTNDGLHLIESEQKFCKDFRKNSSNTNENNIKLQDQPDLTLKSEIPICSSEDDYDTWRKDIVSLDTGIDKVAHYINEKDENAVKVLPCEKHDNQVLDYTVPSNTQEGFEVEKYHEIQTEENMKNVLHSIKDIENAQEKTEKSKDETWNAESQINYLAESICGTVTALRETKDVTSGSPELFSSEDSQAKESQNYPDTNSSSPSEVQAKAHKSIDQSPDIFSDSSETPLDMVASTELFSREQPHEHACDTVEEATSSIESSIGASSEASNAEEDKVGCTACQVAHRTLLSGECLHLNEFSETTKPVTQEIKEILPEELLDSCKTLQNVEEDIRNGQGARDMLLEEFSKYSQKDMDLKTANKDVDCIDSCAPDDQYDGIDYSERSGNDLSSKLVSLPEIGEKQTDDWQCKRGLSSPLSKHAKKQKQEEFIASRSLKHKLDTSHDTAGIAPPKKVKLDVCMPDTLRCLASEIVSTLPQTTSQVLPECCPGQRSEIVGQDKNSIEKGLSVLNENKVISESESAEQKQDTPSQSNCQMSDENVANISEESQVENDEAASQPSPEEIVSKTYSFDKNQQDLQTTDNDESVLEVTKCSQSEICEPITDDNMEEIHTEEQCLPIIAINEHVKKNCGSQGFISAAEYLSQSSTESQEYTFSCQNVSEHENQNKLTVNTDTVLLEKDRLPSPKRAYELSEEGVSEEISEPEGIDEEIDATEDGPQHQQLLSPNPEQLDIDQLDSYVDAAIDQMVPDGEPQEPSSNDPFYTTDTVPPVYSCDVDVIAKEVGLDADESSTQDKGLLRPEGSFKWRYVPSYDDSDHQQLPELEDEDQVIQIRPLKTCGKPLRLGLSKRQPIGHLHKFGDLHKNN